MIKKYFAVFLTFLLTISFCACKGDKPSEIASTPTITPTEQIIPTVVPTPQPTPTVRPTPTLESKLSQLKVPEITKEKNANWLEQIYFSVGHSWYDWIKPVVESSDYFYYLTAQGIRVHEKATDLDWQIINSGTIDGLSVLDNELYFVFDNSSIIKYSDNNELEVVYRADTYADKDTGYKNDAYGDVVDDFCFIDDGILLIEDSGMSALMYNVKTKTVSRFLEDYHSFAVLGKYCYYIEHASREFSIIKRDMVTTRNETVRQDGRSADELEYKDPSKKRFRSVANLNDDIFYCVSFDDVNRICKMNDSFENDEVVFENKNLDVYNDFYKTSNRIFFSVSDGDTTESMYTFDGKTVKNIGENMTLRKTIILENKIIYHDAKLNKIVNKPF
ncbi:MAG: hypothetical protein IKB86_06745 [Clostridia bacterium]|nr:hypothetical protein [Clostridia bacterium]